MFDVFSQKNRILLRELIKTDFKLRYQGSAIGYLWSILKPLMTFYDHAYCLHPILTFGWDVPHFPVALLLANVIWGFFSEATSMGMVSIVSRGGPIAEVELLQTYHCLVCDFRSSHQLCY